MPFFPWRVNRFYRKLHREITRKPPPNKIEKVSLLYRGQALCFFFNNFFALVVAAARANSVRHLKFTALCAFAECGNRKLPYIRTSFVSSCFGYSPLRYSHAVHLLIPFSIRTPRIGECLPRNLWIGRQNRSVNQAAVPVPPDAGLRPRPCRSIRRGFGLRRTPDTALYSPLCTAA